MKIKLLIMTGVLVLAGCSDSIEDLDSKSVKRWEAIIDSEYEKAYEYFTPGYKKTESLAAYASKIANAKVRVEWKSAKFIGRDCESEVKCEVELEVLYKYSFPRKSMGELEVPTKIVENWINKNGKWYFLPKLKKGV